MCRLRERDFCTRSMFMRLRHSGTQSCSAFQACNACSTPPSQLLRRRRRCRCSSWQGRGCQELRSGGGCGGWGGCNSPATSNSAALHYLESDRCMRAKLIIAGHCELQTRTESCTTDKAQQRQVQAVYLGWRSTPSPSYNLGGETLFNPIVPSFENLPHLRATPTTRPGDLRYA